jgi:membrane protein
VWLWDVARLATLQFSADGASFLAQAIAFNVLFATIPLSLVVIAMFGYVYGTVSGDARALDTIDRFVPQIYDIVSINLPSIVQNRGISGVLGLIGLIWSGKNVFGAVSYGLDRALGIPSRHFLLEIVIAVVLVPLLGFAVLIATIVPVVITNLLRFTGLEYLRHGPQIASYAFSLVFAFAVTWLIYTYLPNRKANLRFGVPGALVTAVGYSLGQIAFAIYTAHTNFAQIYGTLSALFVLMLWAYYVCMIFLFGAHVSAQWERKLEAGAAAGAAAASAVSVPAVERKERRSAR